MNTKKSYGDNKNSMNSGSFNPDYQAKPDKMQGNDCLPLRATMSPMIGKRAMAARIGVSEGTIDGWMRRDWTRGHEYVVKGHTTLCNVSRIDQWLIGLAESDHEEQVSKYESGVKENSRTRRTSPAILEKVTSPLQ